MGLKIFGGERGDSYLGKEIVNLKMDLFFDRRKHPIEYLIVVDYAGRILRVDKENFHKRYYGAGSDAEALEMHLDDLYRLKHGAPLNAFGQRAFRFEK
ncbi:MAG: hypothetical protein AABX73_01500 [Nanoarchaeota archaeon]